MLPAANLLGFAGQELSRKMPQKAFAVVLETTFGSFVEIILFMVLLKKGDGNVPVIQAAILGSILANVLLCLGFCFIAGQYSIIRCIGPFILTVGRWYKARSSAFS
jgi:Ca2+:H+ antiporter